MHHVMHIIESLDFGGAEKVVVHLANKLSLHVNVSVCVTKREGELAKQLNDKVDLICLHSPEGNSLRLFQQVRDLVEEKNIDILHCHNWGVFLESAYAEKKNAKCKLIHTLHGPYMVYSSGFKSKLKKKFRNFLERYFSGNVCKTVTVSDSIQEYITDEIGIAKEKLLTIHNGIEDIGSKKPDTKNTITSFVTVGRLAKIKNHKLMLDAFKIVAERNYSFSFTIVGDGPEMNELQEYTRKLGINDYVHYLGFRTEIKEIIEKCDVFLLSSDYEGISIALLESMSLAMPSISTNVGGIPETIIDNETGYLVCSGNIEQYASYIIRFINDPVSVKEMGRKSREHFLNEFREDVVLEKYLSIYRECLRGST